MNTALSGLRRPIQKLPEDVAKRLKDTNMDGQYQARPAYQRNDYLGWISRAKRPATREKRITQMLDELASGDVYMGMEWRG